MSLDCKVDGYPIPTITWTPCNAQENVCDQSMLNISKVQNDGVYTCTAKNSLGNESASTSLGKLTLSNIHKDGLSPEEVRGGGLEGKGPGRGRSFF